MRRAVRSAEDSIPSIRYVATKNQISLSALHLCRALHREASYLPDPASRAFAHAQISERFHRNCHRPVVKPRTTLAGRAGATRTNPTRNERQKVKREHSRTISLLAEGRNQLQLLKRATLGTPTALARVLEQTYGRRGRRKHDLLRDLAPQLYSPMNSDDLRQLSKVLDAEYDNQTNNSNTTLAKLPLFSDKFIALVASQMHQKQARFPKPVPKSTAPKIPIENAWGRKLPAVRIKNITKAWYAETLERLMPPLPEAEWSRLGELAAGTTKWEGAPKPRRRVSMESWTQQEEEEEEEEEVEMVGWASPQTAAQRAKVEYLRKMAGHELTPRYMRRMWASVFAQCPMMKWDAGRGKWSVKWGKVEKGVVLSVDQPDFDFSSFEEDVDENGKVLKNKGRSKKTISSILKVLSEQSI
ncbi:MAG: hypothetical protein Q9195_000458 [Heterodermia aff. obscurata]